MSGGHVPSAALDAAFRVYAYEQAEAKAANDATGVKERLRAMTEAAAAATVAFEQLNEAVRQLIEAFQRTDERRAHR